MRAGERAIAYGELVELDGAVGVRILSAWKNGYDNFTHKSSFFHGGPSSFSYWLMYMSVPYIEIWFELPAPLIAALKRPSVAIV